MMHGRKNIKVRYSSLSIFYYLNLTNGMVTATES